MAELLEDAGRAHGEVVPVSYTHLTVVALALAYIARNVNVGQKVHLDFNDAIALARLAAVSYTHLE